jgi:hypothetical protein
VQRLPELDEETLAGALTEAGTDVFLVRIAFPVWARRYYIADTGQRRTVGLWDRTGYAQLREHFGGIANDAGTK